MFPMFLPKSSRSSMHLYNNSTELFDFIIIKVPNFDKSSPAFYLDSHISQTSLILDTLKSSVKLTDISQDFEIFAFCTNLLDHKEGARIYLEEQGNMVYDDDIKRNLVGYVTFVDPRSRYMGSRLIAVEGCIEAEEIKDEEFYLMWRIFNGISEGESVRKNKPEFLNFQYFNGSKGYESEVYTVCGVINQQGKQINDYVDKSYKKNMKSLRVVDTQNNMIGIVYESYYNLALIKINSKPTSALLLENGDKIDIWKPLYMI